MNSTESKSSTSVEEKLDCEGFLKDQEFWSSDVVMQLAKENQIGEYKLNDNHWKIIKFVREYYNVNGTGPAAVKVAREFGFSAQELCSLFTCGLVKGAYKLAGIPKPPGCA